MNGNKHIDACERWATHMKLTVAAGIQKDQPFLRVGSVSRRHLAPYSPRRPCHASVHAKTDDTTTGPNTSWFAATLAAYPGRRLASGRPGGVGNVELRKAYQ